MGSRPSRFYSGETAAVGGPQSRSGRCGEEKNTLPLLGIDSSVVQPVTWSLYILSYPCHSGIVIVGNKQLSVVDKLQNFM
jgi:hypothetical protein